MGVAGLGVAYSLRVPEANKARIRIIDIDKGESGFCVAAEDKGNRGVGLREPQDPGPLARTRQALGWRGTTRVAGIRSTQ